MPNRPPSTQFLHDWNHKATPVWKYVPVFAQPGDTSLPNVVGKLQAVEAPTDQQQDPPQSMQTDAPKLILEAEGGTKRKNHSYNPEIVEIYFSFESQMGGPKTKVVAFVSSQYPRLFTSSSSERRVRGWVEAKNEKGSAPFGVTDRGYGWRLGQTVLPASVLAFVGSSTQILMDLQMPCVCSFNIVLRLSRCIDHGSWGFGKLYKFFGPDSRIWHMIRQRPNGTGNNSRGPSTTCQGNCM